MATLQTMGVTRADASLKSPARPAEKKLRLGALTALVIGSMVGSGVFSLPQNMAAGAGPLAVLIGWGITAVGMLALVFVYQSRATRKPELDAGPYAYAKAGFGKIAAAVEFATLTGRPAGIGKLEDALAIVEGSRGTRIAPPAKGRPAAEL